MEKNAQLLVQNWDTNAPDAEDILTKPAASC